jgi:formamidopyrimidine-DNA glycosylase
MTGQLIYDGKKTERYAAGHPSDNFTSALPNKQTRVVIKFSDGTLYFNDQRKFGFIKNIKTKDVTNDSFIKKLAKEPWGMTADELYEKFQRHKNSLVKATILDQSIICGLGNIYADESLFAAKIHPERRCGAVTREETEKLLKAACDVMDKSIASGGSTMATYVKADGTKGDYLEKFAQVFHKEGTPCPRCGTKIIKIRVAGRGTHLCPHCQISPVNSESGASVFSESSIKKGTKND